MSSYQTTGVGTSPRKHSLRSLLHHFLITRCNLWKNDSIVNRVYSDQLQKAFDDAIAAIGV